MEAPSTNATLPIPPILDPSHPLAYLAYLPPSLAYELTISLYVAVASLAVQIWDILNNLDEDYKLLKRPLKFPVFAYCISRLSTMMFLLYTMIYNTAPIGNCENLSKITPSLFCAALASTSLLFFFRVSAIYKNNKYVSAFFFFMWLAVLGGSLTTVGGLGGTTVGPTKHCLNGTLRPFVGASVLIPLVNDTLIFIATSFRLMQSGLPEHATTKEALKAAVSGEGLTVFQKALFRDGQAYYLSTAGLSLVALIIFYIDSIPLVYRATFPSIDVTLINVMACRVYRRTKSGKYLQSNITSDELLANFSRELRAWNNAAGVGGSSTFNDAHEEHNYALSA